MARRTGRRGADLFAVSDYKEIVGKSSDDEIDAIRMRYTNYYRWWRQAFVDLMRGSISEDDFYDKLQADRKKAKSPNSPRAPGGLTTSGHRKLLKLAARVLFNRACKTMSEREARKFIICTLSKWAAAKTIYGYLRPD